MKQIQISEELFIQLVKFHLCDDDLWQEEIEQGLQSKLEAMIKRNLYTTYKVAPSPEEKKRHEQNFLIALVCTGIGDGDIFPYQQNTGAWHAPVFCN